MTRSVDLSRSVVSLLGPLTPIYIPQSLGFKEPQEIGRALLAWQFKLTADEVSLVSYVAGGLTNDEIAERLSLAEVKTVKNRIHHLYNKLRVSNRAGATRIAVEFGVCPSMVADEQLKDSLGQT